MGTAQGHANGSQKIELNITQHISSSYIGLDPTEARDNLFGLRFGILQLARCNRALHLPGGAGEAPAWRMLPELPKRQHASTSRQKANAIFLGCGLPVQPNLNLKYCK